MSFTPFKVLGILGHYWYTLARLSLDYFNQIMDWDLLFSMSSITWHHSIWRNMLINSLDERQRGHQYHRCIWRWMVVSKHAPFVWLAIIIRHFQAFQSHSYLKLIEASFFSTIFQVFAIVLPTYSKFLLIISLILAFLVSITRFSI